MVVKRNASPWRQHEHSYRKTRVLSDMQVPNFPWERRGRGDIRVSVRHQPERLRRQRCHELFRQEHRKDGEALVKRTAGSNRESIHPSQQFSSTEDRALQWQANRIRQSSRCVPRGARDATLQLRRDPTVTKPYYSYSHGDWSTGVEARKWDVYPPTEQATQTCSIGLISSNVVSPPGRCRMLEAIPLATAIS